MKRWRFYFYLLGMLILMSCLAFADTLKSPYSSEGESVESYLYAKHIYDNMHKVPVVTKNPNGNVFGHSGELIAADYGGLSYLCRNTGSGVAPNTSWTCLQTASASTCPGGSDMQVQFNDGGSTCGGDSGFIYNKTLDHASLADATIDQTYTFYPLEVTRNLSNEVININETYSNTGSNDGIAGIISYITHNYSSAGGSVRINSSILGSINIANGVTASSGTNSLYAGLYGESFTQGGASTGGLFSGVYGTSEDRGAVNSASFYGGRFGAGASSAASGTNEDLYSLFAHEPYNSGSGTIRTSYALYVEYSLNNSLTTSGLKDYAIYQEGDIGLFGQNIFEGRTGIGDGFTTASVKDTYIWGDAQLMVIGRPTGTGILASYDPGKIVIGTNDTSVVSNDPVGFIDFWGNDTSQSSSNRYARIAVSSEQTIASDISPGTMIISTTPNTVAATPSERIRVNSSGDISFNNHIISSGVLTTVSSCGSGPDPSILGQDNAGKVTVGGGVTSSCKISFGRAYNVAPACVANDETNTLLVKSISTTTDVTLSVSTTFPNDVISYICIGRNEP